MTCCDVLQDDWGAGAGAGQDTACTTPARMQIWLPYHDCTTSRTYRANTGFGNVAVTFVLRSLLPPKTADEISVKVLPSVLCCTLYDVTHLSTSLRPCVTICATPVTLPRSSCSHCPTTLYAALQACGESSIDRAYPVPGLLLL